MIAVSQIDLKWWYKNVMLTTLMSIRACRTRQHKSNSGKNMQQNIFAKVGKSEQKLTEANIVVVNTYIGSNHGTGVSAE